ncbi:MAG TPA: hypothetical protein VFH82_14005 [Gemmatimonadota bacterium]|jgi:hypothetical protein|nr:hypothetical protein [Gemmatimonadota bacterium]
MRSKLGAGTVAGVLAALPYGLIMSIVTSPMGMGSPDSMTMGGSTAMGEEEPMIVMVARMVGSDSLAVAWILLVLGGAVMGALFGVLFGARAAGLRARLVTGALYGAAWWILGSLVLMPVVLGMPAFSPLTTATMRGGATVGLVAYLISGVILGGVFALLRGRSADVG